MIRLARAIAFAVTATLAGIGTASAIDYPTRPVKFIVSYPPGGTDNMVVVSG